MWTVETDTGETCIDDQIKTEFDKTEKSNTRIYAEQKFRIMKRTIRLLKSRENKNTIAD